MRVLLVLWAVSASVAADGAAATLNVCASGCAYAALQPAIDAAVPGDTILLRAGETFVGPFVLRAKAGSSSAWITIRSDAADASLPAAGVRLVPSGRPGANTSLSLLPRLIGQGGALKTTPVIRTEPGAHHYALRFLNVDGAANLGFETLIALGDDTTATPAHDLLVDRVYAHGDQYKGMKRGISLNSVRTDILDSYISDIKAVNADSQAIASYNGAGPFRIIDNYLEASGENVLFGGSDPAVSQLVATGVEIRGNHVFKPLAWLNAILAAPGAPKAAASSSAGALSSGTHYFTVVALLYTDTRTVVSAPSAEVSVAMSGGKAATISWSGVPGADRYRIYRGTAAGAETKYLETSGASTSFTYTGSSESSGTPGSATKWTVKNLLELKNAQQVVIDGNLFENIWQAGQFGYAMVLTPRNQSGGASWVRVRDITITNNIVRHAAGVLQIAGYDSTNTSQQTQRITVRNNLFYDIDSVYWGNNSAKVFLVGEGPASVVIDHNTIISANSTVLYAYGSPQMTGFVFTSNIARHNTYGINGGNGRAGTYSIDMYFPGGIVTNNVLAGGNASLYPTPNAFPTVAQWDASFVNAAADDYRLLTSSVFYKAGAGASVPGADIGVINAAIAGDATPPPPPPPPPPSNLAPVAKAGGPYNGTKGSALTVDGSGSSDPDGSISGYRWSWGDEIAVNAADSAATIVGSAWARTSQPGAAGGVALVNPDKGAAKITAAAASPSSYVEVQAYAAAGVPYHVWFRMQAQGDSYSNDSMFVQFSGAVTAAGAALDRIGTTAASTVILENGKGAGVSGWGWNDDGYGTLGSPVYFATSGLQTIRVQQREDGVMWDQLVLSAGTYFTARPGLTRADSTIVVPQSGSGMVTSHVYPAAGQYPVQLTVTDNGGATASAWTSASVAASAASTPPPSSTNASPVAAAGGPYSGTRGSALTVDGSGSSDADGSIAAYRWTWGDEVVVRAADTAATTIVGSAWARASQSGAADGVALVNPDKGAAKKTAAASSPSSYVEVRFYAAAGVPYHVWFRMRAEGDAYTNDSMFVQFSGAVSAAGSAVNRIGTTAAAIVILENGSGAGMSGWGWNDDGYGTLGSQVYFATSGVQTLRVQQREDGVMWDQLVVSAGTYVTTRPGSTQGDSTVLTAASSSGASPSHVYPAAGQYPIELTVTDDKGAAGSALTTATIK